MVATTMIDFRGLKKKIQKTNQALLKAGNATVRDLAKMGQSHAMSIAPYYSGKTASLIKIFTGLDKEGPYGEIVAENILNDNHKRKQGNFDLVRWMHATNGVLRNSKGQFAKKHIKSGNPRFMRSTKVWLRRQKVSVAEGHFNKIKIR